MNVDLIKNLLFHFDRLIVTCRHSTNLSGGSKSESYKIQNILSFDKLPQIAAKTEKQSLVYCSVFAAICDMQLSSKVSMLK